MLHGLWTDADLQATHVDKWLATQLMNEITLDSKMMADYPYKTRKTYVCTWYNEEPVTIYATDERMLKKFIDIQYIRRPDECYQIIHQYRPINIKS